LHLLASTVALSSILGTLYFGWYRWPGWHLADVAHVVIILAGVDIVIGPLLTFVIARSSKPRRELTRDIAMIVVVQLSALIYGAVSLWHGRPLYYAFSENVLQLVQAYDIDADEVALARQQKTELAPHWYSLPRWIWAPLPQGLPALRTQLKKVDNVGYFSAADKKVLKEHMRAAGFSTDQLNSIPLTGRGYPLLAVFDPASLKITAIFKTK
jgi:hypothetical protein